MKKKTPEESYTEQVQIVTQGDLNGFSRLFGGKLMQWLDIAAGVSARRYCEHNVTTAMVDRLEFHAPAYANDIVLLTAKVTYAGRTSMEVRTEAYVEKNNGKKTLINRAFFIMVAMDENEKPTPVPELEPQTHGERRLWEEGYRRHMERKAREEK